MGVKGFFGFLNRNSVKDAISEHSIEDILQQIRLYRKKHKNSPKILFNLRAFNNYYEQTVRDVIFGCRFNIIKKDFESLLARLKSAGAELIFVSKKNNVDESVDVRCDQFDSDYEKGLEYVKIIGNGSSTKKLNDRLSHQMMFPWQETTIHVLVQSAQKYGTFKESDCFQITTSSHIQLANDEHVFAICGLNTSYLFHRGPWKLFFPAKNSRTKEMLFKKFNRKIILSHFEFNDDEFQLFGVLGGKLMTTLEHKKTLTNHFKKDKFTDFWEIVNFIHKFAPTHKFPLQRDTIDAIIFEIFGCTDNQLRDDFNNAINYQPQVDYPETARNIEEKTKKLLQNDSFSSFAECILYDIPVEILSPFLDARATDMKSLQDLTVGWIKRFSGILRKDIDENRSVRVFYRVFPGNLENYIITPQLPLDLPDWNQLIANEVTMKEKFQTMKFLIGDLISIDDLKTIRLEYMMHVIITTHLVKNNSMTINEAIAITKAVCDNEKKGFAIYPERVNVRAFRVSSLYEKLYSVLLMCLSPLGLNEFIADLTLDNVSFQNNLSKESDPSNESDAFKRIMTLIN